MNRNQKQALLAASARNLAIGIEQYKVKPFFGNQGVSMYRNGAAGDVIGYLVTTANIAPRVIADETDPKVVLALALGTTIHALPESLQIATNELAIAGDDTKRSYSRRVPKLVKLLNAFAAALDGQTVPTAAAVAVPPPQTTKVGGFKLPGRAI